MVRVESQVQKHPLLEGTIWSEVSGVLGFQHDLLVLDSDRLVTQGRVTGTTDLVFLGPQDHLGRRVLDSKTIVMTLPQ